MIKCVNGKYIELTPEEITAMQKEMRKSELAEKARPFSAEEVTAMLITAQINTLSVDDNTALRMKSFYPTFDSIVGKEVKQYFRFTHDDKLWATTKAMTIQSHYPPGNGMESLYTEVCETHSGTLDDPIPYDGNMALENGKHYVQDYVVYLCNRDTGNPVYNALAELVGLYVVEV